MTGKELKNSILQLAISGKLVPQDPTDEPASELLKRIRKEKEKLVKEEKLKKKDLLSEPISDDEKPFEIPESWQWCRLGDIGIFERGNGIKRNETFTSGYPCVRYGEMYTKYRYAPTFDNTVSFTSKPVFDKCRKASEGDLFMALTGENKQDIALAAQYVGKEEIAVGGDLCHFTVLNAYALYFVYLINSPYFSSKKELLATGDIIVHISADKLASIPIAIPPLAEQHRIVTKIEELMPLIDEYDNAQTELDKLNATLPEALKKSVLQQAICGRLVPQDPTDEPASELLKRIRKEKEKLVKEGKLKKKDLLSEPISDDEKPFDIPECWEWVRFGNIAFNRDSERIPLSVNERSTLAKMYDYYGASGIIDKVENYLFDKPLLLIGEDGANLINRSKPIAFIARGKYWVNNHAHVLDFIDEGFMRYICTYINAISLVDYVTGTAQPKMNQEKMNSIPIAIPPLAEQHRIVAKIEKIFAEIDELTK